MLHKNCVWLTLIKVSIFSVAMAFVESAVVVYLRLNFYPEGFSFPLKMIPNAILLVEIIREVATLIMLTIISWLVSKSVIELIAYFIFSFGIWDIFYYVFLKLILDWPASLFDWDVLFLIPIPWAGPVLAPVIVSLSFVSIGIIIIIRISKFDKMFFSPIHIGLIILSCIIIVISFLLPVREVVNQLVPSRFNWEIFFTGYVLGLISVGSVFLKGRRIEK